jgi:hypothetical protein
MGVALPYVMGLFGVGIFGRVELEVALWGFVVLAVCVGLAATATRPSTMRWGLRVLIHTGAVVLFGLASVVAMVALVTEDWGSVMIPAVGMLLLGFLTMVGQPWLEARVERSLNALQALLLCAAQLPAIWAWFEYGALGDHPSRILVRPQPGFALPHAALAVLVAAWGWGVARRGGAVAAGEEA